MAAGGRETGYRLGRTSSGVHALGGWDVTVSAALAWHPLITLFRLLIRRRVSQDRRQGRSVRSAAECELASLLIVIKLDALLLAFSGPNLQQPAS